VAPTRVSFDGLVQATSSGTPEFVAALLSIFLMLNVILFAFNLLPLPPLDGGHFLPYLLPRGSWTALRTLEQYGPILLLVLVVSGAAAFLIGPVIGVLDSLYATALGLIF
jgi:Zn-dependent protease